MIADCETCDRKQVPCSSCETSQRAICFICQGDSESDPYAELMDPPPFCTCPCSCDETPHHGRKCAVHGCFLSGDGSCEETPKEQRCKDCPCGGFDCSAVPGGSLLGCPYHEADRDVG